MMIGKSNMFWAAVVLAVIGGLSVAGRGEYRDEIAYHEFTCSMIQQGHWPEEVASCQK
jgi:hypothetical protein